MSEYLRSKEAHEALNGDLKEHEQRLRHEREKKARESSHEHKDAIGEILSTIEKTAETSASVFARQEKALTKDDSYSPPDDFLERHTFKQTMHKIQRQMPVPQRALSKAIHNPVVSGLSGVADKTIARPSGLLFGGIFSLLANLLVVIVCRYYGYEYNYFIGLVAFVAGFFIGLGVELGLRASNRS
jgi:hypothetical protein